MAERKAQTRSIAEISRAVQALRGDLGPIDEFEDVVMGSVPGIGNPNRQRRLGRIEALEWVMRQRGKGPTAIDKVIIERFNLGGLIRDLGEMKGVGDEGAREAYLLGE